MKIDRFEDIKAWQEARKLTKMVYGAVNSNLNFQKDYRLAGQIEGAAISVMSNIAEGFSRRGNKEFIQFLYIAKSSAAEVQSQLYAALDQDYIKKEVFEAVYGQAELTAKLCSGFIKYLNSQLNKIV
jgi:four helix bundle protein